MCIEGSLGSANSFSERNISSLATMRRVNHPTVVSFFFFWRGKKRWKKENLLNFLQLLVIEVRLEGTIISLLLESGWTRREGERIGREATLMQYKGNICRNETRPRQDAGVRLLSLASYHENRHRHRGQTHNSFTFRRSCASCPGRGTTGMWWS